MLDLYRQLDTEDKAEMRGELKRILRSDKYSNKKQMKNA